MSKVQEAVNNLLGEVSKRNAKIQEKINALLNEYAAVKGNIDNLLQELINYDLADDESGQAATSKEIAKLRSKHDDLQARIAAYQGALNDQSIIQSGIPKVLDVARKARDERGKAIEKKNAQYKKLEQDIEVMKKQLESMSNERSSLVGRSEAKDLLPLLKYIESRPIKRGSEESYLSVFLQGITGELLDQYIEVPFDYKSGPSNNRVEGPNTIIYG